MKGDKMNIELFEPLAEYIKERNGYSVYCVNLPSANTCGDTLEEARESIVEVVEVLLDGSSEGQFEFNFGNSRLETIEGEIERFDEILPISLQAQIALTLRYHRLKSGLTQSKVASQVGITQVSLLRYESGKVSPTAEKFLQILKILKGNQASSLTLRANYCS